jgi:hypothetical protein
VRVRRIDDLPVGLSELGFQGEMNCVGGVSLDHFALFIIFDVTVIIERQV